MADILPSSTGPSPRRSTTRHRTLTLAATLLGLALAGACSSGGDSGNGEVLPPGPAPANLSYPTRGIVLELDQPAGTIVPSVEGLAVWSIAPALPAGLAFSATEGHISGTPTTTAPRTRHTITATNAGGSAQATLDVEVLGRPRFALVANEGDSTLSRLSLEDATTGRPRHAGFHPLMGPHFGPQDIVLHPGGLLAFTVNEISNTVSPHVVDPTDGTVTTGLQESAGDAPQHFLAVHPGGGFLYVAAVPAGDPVQLRTFSIDIVTGELTFLENLASVPGGMTRLLIDPEGRFLLSLHHLDGIVQAYPLDPLSGLPSLGAEQPLGGELPVHGQLGPLGDRLYVASSSSDQVLHFPVSAEGVLGAPEMHAVEDTPGWIGIHPEERYLYAVRSGAEDVRRFDMDPHTGELSLGADEEVVAPAGSRLFVDARGNRARLIDAAGRELRTFGLDVSTGALSEVHRVRTRQGPRAVVVLRGSTPLARVARNAYVTSESGDTVRVFGVGPAGGLTLIEDVPVGPGPIDVELDPLQRFAFVLDGSAIRSYGIEATGTLTDLMQTAMTGASPAAIAVDPSGQFVFLIDSVGDLVTPYAIQDTGALVAGSVLGTGAQPLALAVDPTGQFLFVANDGGPGSSFVTPFLIDPRTGALGAPGTGGIVQGTPTRIGFSAAADILYGTFLATNIVAKYAIAAGTGVPTAVPPAVPAAEQPYDVVLTSDGRFGYVAVRNPSEPGKIHVYDVDPETGALHDGDGVAQPKQVIETSMFLPRRLAISPGGERLFILLEGTPNGWLARSVIGVDGLLTIPGGATNAGASPSDMELRSVLE